MAGRSKAVRGLGWVLLAGLAGAGVWAARARFGRSATPFGAAPTGSDPFSGALDAWSANDPGAPLAVRSALADPETTGPIALVPAGSGIQLNGGPGRRPSPSPRPSPRPRPEPPAS